MAYATAANMMARYDARTLGDLVSDDGVRVPPEHLADNANLTALLADASGAVDAALLQGKRYSTTDLANLSDNSAAYLVSITCTITWAAAWDRRPGLNEELSERARERAEKILLKLKKGDEIFSVDGDASHAEAGLPSITGPSRIEIQNLNGLATRVRGHFYPNRILPNGR